MITTKATALRQLLAVATELQNEREDQFNSDEWQAIAEDLGAVAAYAARKAEDAMKRELKQEDDERWNGVIETRPAEKPEPRDWYGLPEAKTPTTIRTKSRGITRLCSRRYCTQPAGHAGPHD